MDQENSQEKKVDFSFFLRKLIKTKPVLNQIKEGGLSISCDKLLTRMLLLILQFHWIGSSWFFCWRKQATVTTQKSYVCGHGILKD